jgi:tetrapyrrole methylase family protein/MazG family protein
VVKNWQELKREEQAEGGQKRESLLDGVPAGLPALMAAYQYQGKAAAPGFDWERLEDVAAHFQQELKEVLAAQTDAEKQEEVGDLLFMMVNLARWLKVEPETALREANAKFYRRFRFVEEAVKKTGRAMDKFSLAELDGFWNEAKTAGL